MTCVRIEGSVAGQKDVSEANHVDSRSPEMVSIQAPDDVTWPCRSAPFPAIAKNARMTVSVTIAR